MKIKYSYEDAVKALGTTSINDMEFAGFPISIEKYNLKILPYRADDILAFSKDYRVNQNIDVKSYSSDGNYSVQAFYFDGESVIHTY
jgi:hypothetical protein